MAKQTKEEIAEIKEENPKARIDYELSESTGKNDVNEDKKLVLDQPKKDNVIRDLNLLISAAESSFGAKLTRMNQADKDYDGKIPQRSFPHAGACYDKKTEVLTENGWKLFRDILDSDKVFSLNPKTNIAEYMPIQDKQKFYTETVLSFKSEPVDLCVTDNHKIYVWDCHKKSNSFIDASHLFSIGGAGYKIPLTSQWVGKEVDKIYGFDAEDWLEFLGWYISEGWIQNRTGCKKKDSHKSSVYISQSDVHPENQLEIEKLFTRMGLKWNKRDSQYVVLSHPNRHPGYSKIPEEAKKELKSLGKCNDKFIPRKYLHLSSDLLSVLLGSLIKGDGCTSNGRTSYYTTSLKLADNLQELCQKIGLRGTIYKRCRIGEGGTIDGRKISGKLPCYTVSILLKQRAKGDFLKREVVEYNDFVYCVTTPYHTLYVRRNGKACWCGNSSVGIPVIKTKIRQLVRKISRPILKTDPIMPLEPQEKSDVERVEKAEKFLDADARRSMKIHKVVKPLIKDTGKYGTGLCKVPFVIEKEKRTQKEIYHGGNPDEVAKFDELYPRAITDNPEYFIPLHTGETVTFNVLFEKEIYRGPRPERISRKNFITPAGYTDIEKMPFWFEKMTKSWSDLEMDVKNGLYEQSGLDKVIANHKAKKNRKDPLDYTKKQYTVYEGMWKYAYQDVEQKCLFSIILVEKAYLRGIKYPYDHGRPYIIPFKIIDDPDNFDGEALAYDLADIQKLQNMIFNTTIDADAANYPTFKAKKTSKRNFDLERWYPLKVWWVDDMGEFEQMESRSGSSNSFNLMDKAVKIGDDVSGLSELASGRESSGDPNAPGNKTAMLLGETEETMSEYLETFMYGWNEMTYQICELYSQYGTEGKEFRILNEDGEPSLETAPDDLRVRPDMEAHGAEAQFSRAGQKQALMGLMQTLQGDEIIMNYMKQYPQGWVKLWVKLIKDWGAGLGKEADSMIPSQEFINEEMKKIQVQAMQEMQKIEGEKEELRAQGVPEEQIADAEQELAAQSQPETQENQ